MEAVTLSRVPVFSPPSAESRLGGASISPLSTRWPVKPAPFSTAASCPAPRDIRPTKISTCAARVSVCVADVSTMEEVEFTWKGFASEVLVTGDFFNWESRLTLVKTADGKFTAKQKLPPGRYSYKFIVDGVWQHSSMQPTIADGAGGFNNTISIEDKKTPAPPPKAAAAAAAEEKPAAPAAEAKAPPAKKAAPAGKAGGKKAAGKAITPAMEEDVIPALRTTLEKEPDLQSLSLVFDNNELRGSFVKNGLPYDFWAYFPDGTLDGARGFSLTSCGNPPSTVEPFIIDERKITPELVVFWVTKRLFAQKLLSLN